jgi:ABC-2 type transport system permease protein
MFVLCFFVPLLCAVAVYLNHNASVLALFRARSNEIINVNAQFFLVFLGIQGGLAFFLTAFIGPSTIAPDLANGALPLYFCRPFSRAEYVLGKFCALAYVLSLITWIPALVLFGLEASLSGARWMWEHLAVAGGIVITSATYILIIALLALALSAWVRWRIAAGALLLAVNFFLTGFGAAVNAVLHANVGYYLSPGALITRVCAAVFGVESPMDISAWSAWAGLFVMCAICLWLLSKKARAFEVVR